MMTNGIRKIAKRCELPEGVVAHVLRDSAMYGEDVFARVMDAAKTLGYSPDAGKLDGRTHNLGVLFVDEGSSGLTHPFFAEMLNAFKAEVEAEGYDLTFINHDISVKGETYLERCRLRNVDGVCLACVDFNSSQVAELLDSDVPCVAVDRLWEGQLSVLSDNVSGLKLLVDYAVSMGHRHIAFIHGQRNSDVTDARIEAYRAAMKDHDLPIPKGYVVEGRYGANEYVSQLVSELLDRKDRPTCILLPDDATYFGAQEAIRAHELRIPADISIAGYDGIRLTQSLRPQLTTISQNAAGIGLEAARRLIARLEHPDTVSLKPVTIPVTLIKGATMGWCDEW